MVRLALLEKNILYDYGENPTNLEIFKFDLVQNFYRCLIDLTFFDKGKKALSETELKDISSYLIEEIVDMGSVLEFTMALGVCKQQTWFCFSEIPYGMVHEIISLAIYNRTSDFLSATSFLLKEENWHKIKGNKLKYSECDAVFLRQYNDAILKVMDEKMHSDNIPE